MPKSPIEWAHELARRGVRVHPNYWITEATLEVELNTDADDDGKSAARVEYRTVITCACSDGLACKSPGKHPILGNWPALSSVDPAQLEDWWATWPHANLGVNCQGFTIIDVDYRAGGLKTYQWLKSQADSPIVPTFTVRTGNGFHEYYLGEQNKAGGKLVRADSGIDFKSGGNAQVVGPGSEHWSGATYELERDLPFAEMRELPIAGSGKSAAKSAPAYVEGELVPKGSGNDWLESVAGFFRHHSRTEIELIGHVTAAAQSMVEPASPERVYEIAHHRWENSDKKDIYIDPGLGAILAQRARGMLLDIPALYQQPPPEWEIHDLIPRGGITVLYGDGGTKKSFVALDWALCAALELEWMGYKLRPRSTVYVAAEGVSGMPDRIRAWAVQRGVDEKTLFRAPFWVFPESVSLVNEQAVEAAVKMVQEQNANRVIIDTLRRAMPGGDENSTQDVGKVIAACERFVNEAGADVLLIHHSPVANKNRMRGSSAIRDDADVAVGLTRLNPYTSVMHPGKLKDAAEFDPLELHFRVIGLDDDESSLAIHELRAHKEKDTGANRKRTNNEVAADALAMCAVQTPERIEFTTAELTEIFGQAPSCVTRSINALLEAGTLTKIVHGRYARKVTDDVTRY